MRALMKLIGVARRAARQDAGAQRARSRSRWSTRPALLFAENAFENYANLAPRISAAGDGDAVAPRCGAGWAGRSTPRPRRCSTRCRSARRSGCCSPRSAARSRRICAAWSRCSTASSATSAKRAELATLANDSRQIRGALRMLGLPQAERLLGLCQEQIDTYAKSETRVAERRSRAARRVAVLPRLLHRGGGAAASRPRAPDRAAARQAPRRACRATPEADKVDTRGRRSTSCAMRCPSSSPRCIARRPMTRRARAAGSSSWTFATTPS